MTVCFFFFDLPAAWLAAACSLFFCCAAVAAGRTTVLQPLRCERTTRVVTKESNRRDGAVFAAFFEGTSPTVYLPVYSSK